MSRINTRKKLNSRICCLFKIENENKMCGFSSWNLHEIYGFLCEIVKILPSQVKSNEEDFSCHYCANASSNKDDTSCHNSELDKIIIMKWH